MSVMHGPELFLRFNFALAAIAIVFCAGCLLGYAVAKKRYWPLAIVVTLLLGAALLFIRSVVLQ